MSTTPEFWMRAESGAHFDNETQTAILTFGSVAEALDAAAGFVDFARSKRAVSDNAWGRGVICFSQSMRPWVEAYRAAVDAADTILAEGATFTPRRVRARKLEDGSEVNIADALRGDLPWEGRVKRQARPLTRVVLSGSMSVRETEAEQRWRGAATVAAAEVLAARGHDVEVMLAAYVSKPWDRSGWGLEIRLPLKARHEALAPLELLQLAANPGFVRALMFSAIAATGNRKPTRGVGIPRNASLTGDLIIGREVSSQDRMLAWARQAAEV
jgi:hypothetical protein